MPSLDACYHELVEALIGPDQSLEPWPRDPGGWEVVARVTLSRGSGKDRGSKAIDGLATAGLLEPAAVAEASPTEIRDALAEAGVAIPLKLAAILHRLAGWFSTAFPDDTTEGAGPATSLLREQLLAINGVGQGTADAILLALGRACFPIDPGIYRVLVRHGWCDITADYDQASESLARPTLGDPREIDRLSRGLSQVARRFCGVRAPKCDRCPLRPLLPVSGPIDPHG